MAASDSSPGQPVPSAPEAGGAAPRAPVPATHFTFQHKVFSVAGSYFAMADDAQAPTFFVPLGDVQGVLSMPQLVSGFDIKPDSSDASLLKVVERGLRFVKRIQPGDSIPSELLDGSASWSVDDKHRMIAESKLKVQLASWLAGKETEVRDLAELLKIANDPVIRDRIQDAAAELAEKIGIGRARKAEVLERIDRLARELSYIEALRDRFASIKMVGMKLVQFGSAYGPERGFAQEIARVIQLMRKPLGEYEALFRGIDAKTSGILNIMRGYDALIPAVRETRDDLHKRFMIWDELVPKWQDQVVELGGNAEALIRATYRLVVRHFPQGTDWSLQFGGVESRS